MSLACKLSICFYKYVNVGETLMSFGCVPGVADFAAATKAGSTGVDCVYVVSWILRAASDSTRQLSSTQDSSATSRRKPSTETRTASSGTTFFVLEGNESDFEFSRRKIFREEPALVLQSATRLPRSQYHFTSRAGWTCRSSPPCPSPDPRPR